MVQNSNYIKGHTVKTFFPTSWLGEKDNKQENNWIVNMLASDQKYGGKEKWSRGSIRELGVQGGWGGQVTI